MISGQTLRVCPEGKPVPTHRVVARGHAFPDHALTEPVFVLGAVGGIRHAAERATGLMGGDWLGIDGARR
jgi:hypothetical protein